MTAATAYNYDRRVIASVQQPLYGYDSMEKSYEVGDYPYGARLRCKIRYWLEYGGKKGYRFVSQTQDPRNGRWNNPKKSTYTELSGAMYLDEKGHVQWTGIGFYSKASDILEFVKHFPHADLSPLKVWSEEKIKHLDDMIEGRKVWHINNVPKPPSEADLGDYRKEKAEWEEILHHLH